MNTQTSSTAPASPGAAPATPLRMAGWIAGGVGLVGAGALAAMLVTGGKTDPPPMIEATSKSTTLASASKVDTPRVNEPAAESTLVENEKPVAPPVEKAKPEAKPRPAAYSAPVVAKAPPPVCERCGTIESVTPVQRKGEGTGLGAVAGGVLGGVVGHQMGGGSGKQALTVLGAVGGGFAGNEVEKHARSVTVYKVHIRMDNGSSRTLTQSAAPMVGARVKVEGTHLKPLTDHKG